MDTVYEPAVFASLQEILAIPNAYAVQGHWVDPFSGDRYWQQGEMDTWVITKGTSSVSFLLIFELN